MSEFICKAELHIADEYGDNHSRIICELQKGHQGKHRETYSEGKKNVVIEWDGDDREPPIKTAETL